VKDKVRIGCIGCGGNARGHINRLKNIESAEVVATCDIVRELAEKAAEICGSKPYTNLHEMLDKEELDAVWISIPVHCHGEPEEAVIERGLPFFVEKPVARTMELAKKIEKAVNEKGIMTSVGYQLRYTNSAKVAKQLIERKTVGMVVAKYWCGSGRGNRWTQQWEKSGGQLVEQATHTIDMMRYLFGEIEEVYALQANRTLHDIDCPDVNVLALKFENGVLGSMSTTWATDPNDWSDANVLDFFFEHYKVHWTAQEVTVSPPIEGFDGTNKPTPSIDEVFVEAVKTGDASRVLSPYSDGVKSLAVSLAANESARRGEPVKVASLLQ